MKPKLSPETASHALAVFIGSHQNSHQSRLAVSGMSDAGSGCNQPWDNLGNLVAYRSETAWRRSLNARPCLTGEA